MALSPGTRLGPYEITGALGAGGMGEVYRARDTRLQREVAVKILPAHLSSNPDLKQRFEREAKAISSLNHAHICHVYDVGSQDDVDFLVMEFLQGETLADRLRKGALPLEQAVKIGVDIAEALEQAHRSGIVHRDLKPGNVMLTKSGAKLMDFGLAKPAGGGLAGAEGAALLLSAAVTISSPSPTQSPLTAAGTVVGTIQYMSPEQIEGKDADARSDIFALGAVLYEMATGRRAFEGKSQLSVAAAILEKDPEPLSAIHPTAPLALDRLIRTCLAKDPNERFQAAHDLMLQLRWLAEGPAAAQPALRGPMTRRKAIWAACVVAAIVAAAAAGYLLAPPAQNARTLRALVEPPDKFVFDSTGDYGGPPTLSPQGDKIVFCAHGPNSPRVLWVRSLDSYTAQRLDGTDGAYNPFWSPDGHFIGFFANGKLFRISAAGGPISLLAGAPNGRGGSWSAGDVILFAPDFQGPILQVGAGGGKASPATKLDGNKHTTHRWPSFLPDGKHFLYLATNHNGGRADENGIYFASLDSKENRLVVPTDAGGQYASSYLLFHVGTALMAQPFDPGSGRPSGSAVTVVDRVRQDAGVWRTLFTVSQNGLLGYQSGASETTGSQLVWVDRTGKQLGQVGERGSYMDPRISPDGKRLAVSQGDPQREIWIYDLGHAGTKTRLTFSQGTKNQPAWSPDGKTIAFTVGLAASGGGRTEVFVKPASGSGAGKELVGSHVLADNYSYGSWSPDGKYIAYLYDSGTSSFSLYAKPTVGTAEPFVVVAPPSPQANILYYRISPNGRWVAYASDESGGREVYIAPFPRGEGKWQVSTGGGWYPAWRGDGKEVFFFSPGNQYLACPITERENALEVGTPQVLFSANPTALGVDFDAAADGKRFLINLAENESSASLYLVVNWTADLKKK